MNREELQALARIRLREAKALLGAGCPDGAYYLAGYAVECGLKACIAKATRRHDFPDKTRVNNSYTHKLKELVKIAELEADLTVRAKNDLVFKDSWDLAQQWSENSRYQQRTAASAAALISALDNRKHGVMAWLRLHW